MGGRREKGDAKGEGREVAREEESKREKKNDEEKSLVVEKVEANGEFGF